MHTAETRTSWDRLPPVSFLTHARSGVCEYGFGPYGITDSNAYWYCCALNISPSLCPIKPISRECEVHLTSSHKNEFLYHLLWWGTQATSAPCTLPNMC